jgi:hypothetical protein
MTPELLYGGLITVIGAATFVGILIWTLDRDHEALHEPVSRPRLAPRPTTKPTPEAATTND